MRKLLITLDNDLDPWLAKQANQNETVRQALLIYKEDITTDTLAGMRKVFRTLQLDVTELSNRFTELFEIVEATHNIIEELKNR